MACGPEAGNRLVFVSAVDGDPEIMVVDTQSGEASPITHNNALDLEPRWSPGGAQVEPRWSPGGVQVGRDVFQWAGERCGCQH